MKRSLKLMVVSLVVGLLLLATAVPAFAAPGGEKGPPVPVATQGLGIALGNVIAHAANKGANVGFTDPGYPGQGTHTAVGRIMMNNPAVDVCTLDPDCP